MVCSELRSARPGDFALKAKPEQNQKPRFAVGRYRGKGSEVSHKGTGRAVRRVRAPAGPSGSRKGVGRDGELHNAE